MINPVTMPPSVYYKVSGGLMASLASGHTDVFQQNTKIVRNSINESLSLPTEPVSNSRR